MIVRAADRQTFYDLAIQYTGVAENAAAIALTNGRSPTDDLEAGEEMEIPDGLPVKQEIADYYAARKLIPATAFRPSALNVPDSVIIGRQGNERQITVTSNSGWRIVEEAVQT
jgi:hypothetical protein